MTIKKRDIRNIYYIPFKFEIFTVSAPVTPPAILKPRPGFFFTWTGNCTNNKL